VTAVPTVLLDRAPSLRSAYRRVAVQALRRRPAGDTLPGVELALAGVPVDRAHLAAYDRVCGFRLGDTLPATYPHVMSFPVALALMSRPDFPLPLAGIIHIANTVEQRRPIDAAEQLEFRVRAADLRPHDRGRQVDVVVEALAGAEPVWLGRSTYLRRESGSAGKGTVYNGRPAEPPGSGRLTSGSAPLRPRAAAEPPGSDRLTSGSAPLRPRAAAEPTAVWRVERRVGPDYAAVSGDRNPIHTSRVGARLFGFPRPIAHGMWSMARCLASLEGRLPGTYTAAVAFKLPILLPATVGFAARPDGDGWQLDLHDVASGRPHLTGSVTPG
jgi:MaoC like domain